MYGIVCLMKLWWFSTSSAAVASMIRRDDLEIERYTERLVQMFSTIVAHDAQSPHGKFYFVTKHLQERFFQIKADQNNIKTENDGKELESCRPSAPKQPLHTNPPDVKGPTTNQTPLHLLSNVAVSTSTPVGPGHPQQQPPFMHTQMQPPVPWYDESLAGGAQQQHMMGIPQGNYDPTGFDFAWDFGMGNDADWLFIPDGFTGNYNMPGYNAGPPF